MDISDSEISVHQQLLNLRESISTIKTRLDTIEDVLDATIKSTEATGTLFNVLNVNEPTLTELLYAMNTYLVAQGCVDSQLQITPNEYLKTVFIISEKISYANLIHLLLLKLKIDMSRINQYV